MKRKAQELEKESRITVGELRRQLSPFPDSMRITFGNTVEAVPLAFYRIKQRGDGLLQIELTELLPEVVSGSGPIQLEETSDGGWRRIRPDA
jgi:hypothetical protein